MKCLIFLTLTPRKHFQSAIATARTCLLKSLVWAWRRVCLRKPSPSTCVDFIGDLVEMVDTTVAGESLHCSGRSSILSHRQIWSEAFSELVPKKVLAPCMWAHWATMIRVLVIIAGIDPWYFSWSMIGILRTLEQALVASCWNWSYFLNVCLHFSFLRVIVVHLWEVLCWWIASKVVPNDMVNLPWVVARWTESQEASWQWCWQQTSAAVIDPALVNLDIEVISTALQRESGIVVVWFVKGLLCHPPWPIDRVYLIFGVEAFH